MIASFLHTKGIGGTIMLAAAKLQEVLEKYTQDFVPQVWANGKYKWEAIQTFQTHWDVNVEMKARSVCICGFVTRIGTISINTMK